MSVETRPTFTPGPWRIEEEPYRHIRAESGCVWADDYKPDTNARLIAAAPEMYEALKALVEDAVSTHPLYKAARAALAKAEGR